MKLTVEQIAFIEETLILNGVIYEDIKLELTDHIASEIEVKITENETDFQSAMKEVFESWKNQFTYMNYSYWLGRGFSGPKIATDKMIKIVKSEYKCLAVLVILCIITFQFDLGLNLSRKTIDLLRLTIKGILIFTLVTSLSARMRLVISKWNTTYSVLFKRKFGLIILYSCAFLFNIYKILPVDTDETSQLFSLLFVTFFLFYTFNSFRLLANHFKIKKQFEAV